MMEDNGGTSTVQFVVAVAELWFATTLAGLAAYIAYQQLQTNRQRLESERRDRELLRQRDMYDRRWHIYDGVLTYITDQRSKANSEAMLDLLGTFDHLRREAHFLFGQDLNQYLEKLAEHGENLYQCLDEGRDQEHVKELAWFLGQRTKAPSSFEDYLRLSDQ